MPGACGHSSESSSAWMQVVERRLPVADRQTEPELISYDGDAFLDSSFRLPFAGTPRVHT